MRIKISLCYGDVFKRVLSCNHASLSPAIRVSNQDSYDSLAKPIALFSLAHNKKKPDCATTLKLLQVSAALPLLMAEPSTLLELAASTSPAWSLDTGLYQLSQELDYLVSQQLEGESST